MEEETTLPLLAGPFLTRRGVVALGCAGLAAVGLPVAAHAEVAPVGFVFDTRFANSLAMPASVAWTHYVDGDVTRLWVDRLDQAWRSPGSPVAGATGADALFVLEHLAWDRQRRVMLRTTLAKAGGPVPLVRWLIAPKRVVA